MFRVFKAPSEFTNIWQEFGGHGDKPPKPPELQAGTDGALEKAGPEEGTFNDDAWRVVETV